MKEENFSRLVQKINQTIENQAVEIDDPLLWVILKEIKEDSAESFVDSLRLLLQGEISSASETLKYQIQITEGSIERFDDARTIMLSTRLAAVLYLIKADRSELSLQINLNLLSRIALIHMGIMSFGKESTTKYTYFHHLLIKIPSEIKDHLAKEILEEERNATKALRETLNEAEGFQSKWHDQIAFAVQQSEHYSQIIEKHKIGLSIEALAASYEIFRQSKAEESKYTLITLVICALLTLAIPVGLILHNAEILASPSKIDIETFVLSGIPFIGIELLLLFFSRTIYNHYKSIEAQILQIDVKIASSKFIKEFTKFKSESNTDFSKFESLIFSGIVASHEKTPHAFEGLSDLANLIKASRKPGE